MEGVNKELLPKKLTFFEKALKSLKKFFVPTRLGYNELVVSMKRKALIRSYEQYNSRKKEDEKKDELNKMFNQRYLVYLESIDKLIMDSIYRKVKLDICNEFEKQSILNYYKITTYKKSNYEEYKLRKERFLIELDYILQMQKGLLSEKHEKLYAEKQTRIHRDLLRVYSQKIMDKAEKGESASLETYVSIFIAIEEYTEKIFPILIKYDTENEYTEGIKKYDELQKYMVGKLDERSYLEKNLLLLSISRDLFTHSLPLNAAENCYNKLLKDTRILLMNTKNDFRKEKAYKMIQLIIEKLNEEILTTKVFWENSKDKEENKLFWSNYRKAETEEEKEILMIYKEKRQIADEKGKYQKLIKYYNSKLVEYGVMRKCSGYKTLEGKFERNLKEKNKLSA